LNYLLDLVAGGAELLPTMVQQSISPLYPFGQLVYAHVVILQCGLNIGQFAQGLFVGDVFHAIDANGRQFKPILPNSSEIKPLVRAADSLFLFLEWVNLAIQIICPECNSFISALKINLDDVSKGILYDPGRFGGRGQELNEPQRIQTTDF
jgi:hypothetical protein